MNKQNKMLLLGVALGAAAAFVYYRGSMGGQ